MHVNTGPLRSLTPILLVPVLALALASCGGSGGGSSSTPVLRISPTAPSIRIGKTQTFTAYVDNGGAHSIVWTTTGGTIAADGTLTAPSTAGDITVKAAFQDQPSVSASTVVHVVAGVQLMLTSPVDAPIVIPRSKLFFNATVTGSSDTLVNWNLVGTSNGASVDTNGVFIAPDTLGTYTIQARSHADPTQVATKQIQVVANANVRLKIQGKNDIVLQLSPTNAPNTCANFVSLVNKAFYDGIYFHRYVAGFVIQAGDPLTKTLPLTDPSIGTGGPGYTIPYEVSSLTHVQYALAMARGTDINSAGSQFYVTLAAQPSLDGQYCVFGNVLSGTDVIDALRVGDLIVSARTETP